jgi:hypothetical protein
MSSWGGAGDRPYPPTGSSLDPQLETLNSFVQVFTPPISCPRKTPGASHVAHLLLEFSNNCQGARGRGTGRAGPERGRRRFYREGPRGSRKKAGRSVPGRLGIFL